jgi:hypothetical protein
MHRQEDVLVMTNSVTISIGEAPTKIMSIQNCLNPVLTNYRASKHPKKKNKAAENFLKPHAKHPH